VPGWHVKTKELEASGKLKVVGITQEQHPDRTVLFMQWQDMKWQVMLDSLNLLGCKGIPFTLLIDEHGIVRYENPKDADLETFLATTYEKPASLVDDPDPYADANDPLFLWGGDAKIDDAIAAFQARVQADPKDGKAHFRLGVAYRRRYDSPKRQHRDFNQAISAWEKALAIDPSQYIWRRRIQQYGPRLDKPYSFYDWVHEARETIVKRGETPHALVTEPSGAEFAYPEKASEEATPEKHPDPEGKVPVDRNYLVKTEATAVPSTKKGAEAFRVHLKLTPDTARKVHWTNDAGPLLFFPEASEHYAIKHFQKSEAPQDKLTSTETRVIEFELRPNGTAELPASITGVAYYYVCEDVNGQCLFLRQPITVSLR
jgi:hypothetical protein